MQNPYISLLSTAWRYARQERKRYLLVYSMFVLANVVSTMNPLLYGWFIDKIQRKGSEIMSYLWIYVLAYVGLQVGNGFFMGRLA